MKKQDTTPKVAQVDTSKLKGQNLALVQFLLIQGNTINCFAPEIKKFGINYLNTRMAEIRKFLATTELELANRTIRVNNKTVKEYWLQPKPSLSCYICKQTLKVSTKNQNLYDGFEDLETEQVVCTGCRKKHYRSKSDGGRLSYEIVERPINIIQASIKAKPKSKKESATPKQADLPADENPKGSIIEQIVKQWNEFEPTPENDYEIISPEQHQELLEKDKVTKKTYTLTELDLQRHVQKNKFNDGVNELELFINNAKLNDVFYFDFVGHYYEYEDGKPIPVSNIKVCCTYCNSDDHIIGNKFGYFSAYVKHNKSDLFYIYCDECAREFKRFIPKKTATPTLADLPAVKPEPTSNDNFWQDFLNPAPKIDCVEHNRKCNKVELEILNEVKQNLKCDSLHTVQSNITKFLSTLKASNHIQPSYAYKATFYDDKTFEVLELWHYTVEGDKDRLVCSLQLIKNKKETPTPKQADLPAVKPESLPAKAASGSYQFLINHVPPVNTIVSGFLGDCALIKNIKPAARIVGIDKDKAVIDRWQKSDKGIILINNDFMKSLEAINPAAYGKTLVYLDVPSLNEKTSKQVSLYDRQFDSIDSHQKLLDKVVKFPCYVMLQLQKMSFTIRFY